jgi:RNA polymerase sigma-70 factor, ECF subfamily
MTDAQRQTAFDELLAQGQSLVWTLCLRVCGREDLARDAFQETWLAAWRALPAFRGEAKATTWLWRIAVRACGDTLRRERRIPQGLDELPEVVDETPNPADRLEREDLANWLLVVLTPRQRALVHLRYTQELSYEEIAAALEISLAAVKTGLHRARAAMRARWERAQRPATSAAD